MGSLVVLAATLAAAAFAARWASSHARRRAGNNAIVVMSRTALTRQHGLATVAVAGQRYLVGYGNGAGVSVLDIIEPAADDDGQDDTEGGQLGDSSSAGPHATQSVFAATLRDLLGGPRRTSRPTDAR